MTMRLEKFAREESGASTILAIFWFVLFCGLGGLAVDSANAFRYQTAMQVAADAAAHAAVADLPDETAARSTAIAYAESVLPPEVYGDTLRGTAVEFGSWSPDSRTFTAGATPATAVRVTLRSDRANGNPVDTSFLRIVGKWWWDINVSATAVFVRNNCFNDGLIAGGVLDIQSNNNFVNHICLHGQEGFNIQQNNFFEEGVSVTVPNHPADIGPGQIDQLYGSNTGLEQADNKGYYQPQIDQIEGILDALMNPQTAPADVRAEFPFIFWDLEPVMLTESDSLSTAYALNGSNRIYYFDCSAGNKNVNIDGGVQFRQIGIVTNCNLGGANGTQFIEVVMGSVRRKNNSNPVASINFASGVVFGLDDDCADGGGTTLYSMSSIQTASGSQFYGSRMYAIDNIRLAAAAGGIEGIAAHAGGDINLASNNAMGLCHADPNGVVRDQAYAIVD